MAGQSKLSFRKLIECIREDKCNREDIKRFLTETDMLLDANKIWKAINRMFHFIKVIKMVLTYCY